MKPEHIPELRKGDKLYEVTHYEHGARGKHHRTKHFLVEYVIRSVLPITRRVRVERVATKTGDASISIMTWEFWRVAKMYGRTPNEAIRMKLAELRADTKRHHSALVQAERRLKFVSKMKRAA